MDIDKLKSLKLSDLLKVDFSKLRENEAKYVERRLIRTANRRIESLKKAGLISESHLTASERKGLTAYKAPKDRIKVTRGGKQIRVNVKNKLAQSANRAKTILLKRTSKSSAVTAQEERYRKTINDTLRSASPDPKKYKDKPLTRRQLKRIGKLMKQAEELYGMGRHNRKFTGSPQIVQTIVDIVKSRKYIRNDDAELIISEAVANGYKSAQDLMADFLGEEPKGTSIDFNLGE